MQKKLSLLLITLFLGVAAQGQSTAFTYQGKLSNGGQPASGNYDLCFQLLDAGTNVVAGPVTNSPVWVTNGLFTVTLDFGSSVFDGSQRWLELGVRGYGQAVAYTVLTPFQPLTATPYAIRALTSDDASVALQATTNEVNSYSNSVASLLAAAVSNTNNLPNFPYITLSPHGIADHCSSVSNCGMMFGIDTPGTTTGGLQEAVNAINASATNVSAAAGGKIEIAPGTVYTYNQVNFNGTNCTYVIEGAGLSASGILYMGNQNISVLSFVQPAGFTGSCPQFFLRDLFVAATNDIQGYLISTLPFGKIGIEDCWFGYFPFMAYGNGYNGSQPFGFEPPSYGGKSASYLTGIYLEGASCDDIAWVNNCDFSGLACGLIDSADHAVVDNNMFLFCGNNSAWPNVGSYTYNDNLESLMSLGVSIVQGHSTHMNCRYHNNYFYGGNYAYAMDDDYDPGAVVSDGDGFESMNGDMFISTQSSFTQMNTHGGLPDSMEMSSSYLSGLAPYTFLIPNTNPSQSIREVTLTSDKASFTGYTSFSFGGASVNFSSGTAFTGNGSGLTSLNAAQLTGTVTVAHLPGITTNYAITGGPTLYITNGLIMSVH